MVVTAWEVGYRVVITASIFVDTIADGDFICSTGCPGGRFNAGAETNAVAIFNVNVINRDVSSKSSSVRRLDDDLKGTPTDKCYFIALP